MNPFFAAILGIGAAFVTLLLWSFLMVAIFPDFKTGGILTFIGCGIAIGVGRFVYTSL